MATLVLSTVGMALGGPVGGAIGALIGQSFDQQFLGPATRGPRLGDLNVQTSSYGTDIPRMYGSMRVAGSVVWATDLVESEQTNGAKGQPDATYSYSVSLAVALSSRVVGAIGRIWADGKLLRGSEGDFKVPVTFRFYEGSESQDIDPLIGSIEGIANTPAYRGIALAVFENFELADFGNRIPFMTFEVIADATPPAISAIMADASDGAIAATNPDTLEGYAAYGRSIAAAVQPLVDCFGVSLLDDGSTLRPPADSTPVALDAEDLGNSPDGQNGPRFQREQQPARAVPSTLRLTYYDPARDYQTGEARANAGEQGSNEVRQELPAVLSADDAKTLVQRMLARQWSARDRLTLRLPPARLTLEPGSIVEPNVAPGLWLVEKCTIDGFVTIVELRPSWKPNGNLSGESGRIVPNSDVVAGPATLALIDGPGSLTGDASGPALLIAASSATPGWNARPLSISGAGQTFVSSTAARKSIVGQALTVLDDAEPYLVDDAHSVDIELVDHEQWLTSCSDDALAEGTNLAILGGELIQYGSADPLGGGRFRLSHLLRARGATEWATAAHAAGETFCVIDSNSLQPLQLPIWMRGSAVSVADRKGSTASVAFAAESVKPLTPANLAGALNSAGDLALGWTRRTRAGLAWLDEVDAPLGESREAYSVTIANATGTIELASEQATLVVASSDLAPLGAGAATVQVRQLGDWAASRPAQIVIQLP